jgi:hypothetical protein
VPAVAVERIHDAVRDEPAAARIEVPISKLALLMGIEPLRLDQIQLIFGSRHRHIQQPPFAVSPPACPRATNGPALPFSPGLLVIISSSSLTRIRVFKIKQIRRRPQRVDMGVILIQSPVLGMGE